MDTGRIIRQPSDDGYLDGQLLIAMPSMGDLRFERSVIFLCAHSSEGAWGLVLNRPSRRFTFPDLLTTLELMSAEEAAALPEAIGSLPVMRGGPVEKGRGFVLHSDDYFMQETSVALDGGVALTASTEILRAIAVGLGPRRALLALGYAGWGAGQLDQEIQANGWLSAPADFEFLFDVDGQEKYANALARIGVDLALLSGEAGHG